MFNFPVSGYKITSRFGPRINPITGAAQNHGGLDLSVPVGTPVLAIGAGTVRTLVKENPTAGNYLEVDHGNGFWSRYLHLSEFVAKPGDVVTVGQRIALSGGGRGVPGAGASTGAHLHLEVWKGQPYRGGVVTDPLPYLTAQAIEAVKGAAREVVTTGKRAARRGAAALRRNWWIAGIGVVLVAGAAWMLTRAKPMPRLPAPNPRQKWRG